DVRLTDLRPDSMAATAQVTWQRDLGEVPAGTTRTLTVPMPGAHNLTNAAAALLAATAGLGQALDAVLAGLAAFPGTHRRVAVVGGASGVRGTDASAHNPDTVAAVVRGGRGLVAAAHGGEAAQSRRLVVVFQPHLFTRTRDFATDS